MLARLSDSRYPALRGLTTRSPGDPAIALLDAWALVADVLTFYDERIANEGYLRTATERRSVVELARLVGYAPRPGVAASIFLAYTIDPTFKGEAIIRAGSRSQSVPGPGELPQTFETTAVLKGARLVEQPAAAAHAAAERAVDPLRPGRRAGPRLHQGPDRQPAATRRDRDRLSGF